MVALPELKICKIIVGSVSVSMVNGFLVGQGSPKGLSHDQPVFLEIPSAVRVGVFGTVDLPVPLGGHDVSTLAWRTGALTDTHVVAVHEQVGKTSIDPSLDACRHSDGCPFTTTASAQSGSTGDLGRDGFPLPAHVQPPYRVMPYMVLQGGD